MNVQDRQERENNSTYREREARRRRWVLLGVAGGIAGLLLLTLAIPKVQCELGLSVNACVADGKDMELYLQTESGQPLAGVNVEWNASARKLNQLTNEDGLIKIRIPATGDTKLTFTATGYPEQVVAVNFARDPKPIRVIRLVPTGIPQVRSMTTLPNVIVVAPSAGPTTISPEISSATPVATPSIATSPSPASSPRAPQPTTETTPPAASFPIYNDGQLRAGVTRASLDLARVPNINLTLRNTSSQTILMAITEQPSLSTERTSTDECKVQGLPTLTNLPSDPNQANPASFYRLPAGGEVKLSLRCTGSFTADTSINRFDLILPITMLAAAQYQPVRVNLNDIPVK
jgi:hypothetical protein